MRKNKMIAALTIAAAMMMAVTACGSKNAPETTAVETTEAAAEVKTSEETTKETSAEMTTEESTEETTEETEKETEEEATGAPEAGEVKSNGSFQPANGRYAVTPPAGWSLDEGSDEQYATFLPENGDDMLELVFLSGEESSSMVEILPATADEYKQYASRDGDMDIVLYEVDVKDNGSQTFKYAMRYNNPSDGVRYIAVSGKYDAAKKEYIAATGTVVSEGEDIIKAVQTAVDSFQVK